MLVYQLGFALAGFLLGGVLFSYHVPLWVKRVDIVKASPDHNPGTANAIKYAGAPLGMLCLIMDMVKGYAPVMLSIRAFGLSYSLLPLVMLTPALGHALAPFYPFHGGKAIATAFGVLAALLPFSQAAWALVFWYLFFSLVVVINPHEKRSVATFACFALSCVIGSVFTRHFGIALGCALLAAVPIHCNYRDIRRAEFQMQSKAAASQTPPPIDH